MLAQASTCKYKRRPSKRKSAKHQIYMVLSARFIRVPLLSSSWPALDDLAADAMLAEMRVLLGKHNFLRRSISVT